MISRFGNVKTIVFICLLFVSAVSCFAEGTAPAPESKDVILDLVPNDSLACVRINNLQNSLMQLDQYLAGASPIPLQLSMLATMQIAGIFGDPTMTGLNMQGNVAMVAMQPNSQSKDIFAFFMIPTTSNEAFLKNNTNLSAADANGIYLLNVEQSPVGKMALLPVKNQNYLLMAREQNKAVLLTAQAALADKKAALSSRFDAAASKAASTNPLWCYVNLDAMYKLFQNDIENGIEEIQKSMAEQAMGPEISAFQPKLKAIFGIYLYFIKQADWASLSLIPSQQVAQLEMLVSAKPNSELAGILKPASDIARPWQLAGYTNDAAPLKFLARMNQTMLEQLSVRTIDLLMADMTESEKAPLQKIKSSIGKWSRVMGDEVAGTFAYKASTPPFEIKEIIQIEDANSVRALQKEMLESLNGFYAAMGLDIDATYAESVEKHNQTDIGLFQFKLSPKDANDPADDVMQTMYGKEGMQYPFAITSDRLILSIGPDAMNQIKALIDNTSPGAAAGDIKTALDTIPNSGKADLIMSINIPQLMKGLSDMASKMALQGGSQMPDFWEGIPVKTSSAMSIAAFVENGRVRGMLMLPKQHLTETVQIFTQVQQKTMAYYMQQSQPQNNVPSSDMNTLMNEPADPILEQIGKPATELKLKDLAGNEIILSTLKGKPVIIDFWATWCPPCKEMIPQLIELRKQYKDDQLALLGISNEKAEKLKPFVEKTAINYTIISYMDELPEPYDTITALPTMLFIDAEGVIRDIKIGTHGPDELKKSVEKIMKK